MKDFRTFIIFTPLATLKLNFLRLVIAIKTNQDQKLDFIADFFNQIVRSLPLFLKI